MPGNDSYPVASTNETKARNTDWMKEQSNKSAGERLGALAGLIKNAKFLLLSAMALAVVGLAIVSGDGKDIVLDFYAKVTGRKFQTFSPIDDSSHETYMVLQDKLSRDTDIQLQDADISVFEESENSHKYRIEVQGDVHFYRVEQQRNGSWKISKE